MKNKFKKVFFLKKRFESDTFWLNWLIWSICIVWCSFQVWTIRYPLPAFYQRSIHFLFDFLLIFLTINYKGKNVFRFRWSSVIFSIATVCCILYALLTWSTKAYTRGLALPLDEMVFAWIFIIITIEVCRRVIGYALPIISFILILYGRFGELLPSIISHRNYSFERMATSLYISTDGIMGLLAHVSTTFVFIFVLFGSFLRVSGGGEFFIKFSYALLGTVRGGPAKVAVIASTLFGMVSGSASANVAGTGQFTIPLMKKYGYPAHFAAAVEATTSAGGQIMPPILGGSAFIMMEILGVSYIFVIKSIVIIACLYYFALFVMVDIEAQKLNLRGLKREELPRLFDVLKEGWFFFIPPFILIFLLAYFHYTPTLSGLYATFSIILVSWFAQKNRMGIKQILFAMEDACYTFRPIGAVLACSGLIVALVNMTGLGLRLGSILINVSGGNLPLLLFLGMISSIILGMGVPNTAAYVLLSVLIAPTLIKLGVIPISAHLFIFYFAVFSGITPPLAPDSFIAAGIAEAPFMKTAMTACKIGLIGLILPYMMVYNQAFLFVGNLSNIFVCIITSIIGIIALGSSINGYLCGHLNALFRLFLLISAIILIVPGLITDLIGFTVFIIITLRQNPRIFKDLFDKYFSSILIFKN